MLSPIGVDPFKKDDLYYRPEDTYSNIGQVTTVTNPPEYYDPPTHMEIEEVLAKYKIDKNRNETLFQDLLNVCANDFIGASREEVMKDFHFNESPSDEALDALRGRQDMLRTMPSDLKALSKGNQESSSLLKKALRSPLDRAAVLTRLIQEQQQGGCNSQGKNDEEQDEEDKDGNVTKVKGKPGPFAQESKPEEIWEKLDDLLEEMVAQEEIFSEDEDFDRLFQLSPEEAKEMQLGSELDKNINLRSHSTKSFVEDTRSRKKKQFQFTSFSQLPKVNRVSMAMPDFKMRLAKKELSYRNGYHTEQKKQLLFILVDWSGSMSDVYKLMLRNAYLYNRLQAVARGDAELIYARYVTTMHKPVHIKTKQEAWDFFRKERKQFPTGGVCDFEPVFKSAMEYIDNMYSTGAYTRPEILVIHDGQDRFKAVNPGITKFHGLMLGQDHTALRSFCVSTGGSWIVQDFSKQYPPAKCELSAREISAFAKDFDPQLRQHVREHHQRT